MNDANNRLILGFADRRNPARDAGASASAVAPALTAPMRRLSWHCRNENSVYGTSGTGLPRSVASRSSSSIPSRLDLREEGASGELIKRRRTSSPESERWRTSLTRRRARKKPIAWRRSTASFNLDHLAIYLGQEARAELASDEENYPPTELALLLKFVMGPRLRISRRTLWETSRWRRGLGRRRCPSDYALWLPRSEAWEVDGDFALFLMEQLDAEDSRIEFAIAQAACWPHAGDSGEQMLARYNRLLERSRATQWFVVEEEQGEGITAPVAKPVFGSFRTSGGEG